MVIPLFNVTVCTGILRSLRFLAPGWTYSRGSVTRWAWHPPIPGRNMPAMPRLQRKSFATPDQVRKFPTGQCDIVTLDETSIGRFVFQPGWRWSKDVKPVAGTKSCQFRHLGYTISGSLEVRMDDGTMLVIRAGEAY